MENAVDERQSSSRKPRMPKFDRGRQLEGLKKDKHRRESMAQMYNVLRSMVPDVSPEDSRAEILHKAFMYINSLEKEKVKLERLKKSSDTVTTTGPPSLPSNRASVTVSESDNLMIFEIQSLIRRNLVTDIIRVFHQHRAEVFSINIAADEGWIRIVVTAGVSHVEDYTVENIKRDIFML